MTAICRVPSLRRSRSLDHGFEPKIRSDYVSRMSTRYPFSWFSQSVKSLKKSITFGFPLTWSHNTYYEFEGRLSFRLKKTVFNCCMNIILPDRYANIQTMVFVSSHEIYMYALNVDFMSCAPFLHKGNINNIWCFHGFFINTASVTSSTCHTRWINIRSSDLYRMVDEIVHGVYSFIRAFLCPIRSKNNMSFFNGGFNVYNVNTVTWCMFCINVWLSFSACQVTLKTVTW